MLHGYMCVRMVRMPVKCRVIGSQNAVVLMLRKLLVLEGSWGKYVSTTKVTTAQENEVRK